MTSYEKKHDMLMEFFELNGISPIDATCVMLVLSIEILSTTYSKDEIKNKLDQCVDIFYLKNKEHDRRPI